MQGEAQFYFQLMWLYVVMIIFLMVIMCFLYFYKKLAQRNERMTLSFSQHIIEGMDLERKRISRELHDVILPQVIELPVGSQIRAICMELMPPDFTRLPFKELLADICDKFKKQTGIECGFFMEEDLSFSHVSADNLLHLYRMTQEAFTNIGKHSKAKKVMLVVRRNNEGILICVSDDGIGLSGSKEGIGMESLRQRAAIIGAKIYFISESGNGLMVKIEFTPQYGE
ncbi:MAG: histidine kinase [Treponema sp.]|nr:histidine kinase [Treponema sp.]MCL2251490.1 histidine kinase [Treponema sp.]